MTDESPKELLGKAFGAEPPVRLDRDEIFRRGRRQVRVRRIATSGGVAAAVVAVMLGAAALSNLPGGGNDVSPAQSTNIRPAYPPTSSPIESAPAGPQLPLATTTSVFPPTDQRATELTQVLAEAKLIPSGYQLLSQGDGTNPLVFVRLSESYQAAANLKDPYGGGNLQVSLSRATPKRIPATCDNLGGRVLSCTIATDYGMPMVVATQRADDGVLSYVVNAVRPDGTEVMVTAGNGIRGRASVTISGAKPPLDFEVLKKIAALPRLTIG